VHRFARLLIARRQMRDMGAERTRMSLSQLIQTSNHRWHGTKLGQPDWSPSSHSLAFSAELPIEGLRLHMIFNAYWEPLEFELPPESDSTDGWRRWIDTALDPPDEICEWQAAKPFHAQTYQAGARSVVVLVAGLKGNLAGG
jgi:glycogen operon protein